jgi:membrane-associated phospholipid phosphatase
MNIKKRVAYKAFLFMCCAVGTVMCADEQDVQNAQNVVEQQETAHRAQEQREKRKCERRRKAREFGAVLLEDALQLHKNLFSVDSFKIITTFFPFYVGSRMIDDRLQCCFYDGKHHKNKYIIPKWCHDVAQFSISVPIIGLGSQMFFGKTLDMRHTSRVFLLGVPFLIWTKDLIKKLEFEANLRPWHEDFDCKKRAGGGFPSGHMAEITYTATLYGMRYGPAYALPLSGIAAFLGVSFVACNRHYLSQIVAGAGLGVIYAFAADKVIESRLACSLDIGMTVASNGAPALSLTYQF